jgi:uroporphyrinogen-III decarboxylase
LISNFERSIAAINLEEPDRVPCFELGVNLATIEGLLGRPTVSAALGCMTTEQLRTLARDTVEAYAVAGLDMVPASAGFPENYREGFIPERLTTNRWVDEFGRIWEDRPGLTGLSWYIGGTVKSSEDLNKVAALDPQDPGRIALAKETVRCAREKNMAVAGYVDGPFLTAYMTAGLSDFLVSIYRDRVFADRLLDLVTRFNCAQARRLVELGVDAIIIGEDMAGSNGPLINPRDLKNIMFPFLVREIEEVRRTGTKVLIHSDGNTMPVFEDIVSLGIDGYQAIEGDAGMDIGLLKDKYGDRLCLIGNVDCGNTLTHGSPSEVVGEARHVIDCTAGGGGFFLGSSNSIHDGVKLENLLAMTKTAVKYGKYAP